MQVRFPVCQGWNHCGLCAALLFEQASCLVRASVIQRAASSCPVLVPRLPVVGSHPVQRDLLQGTAQHAPRSKLLCCTATTRTCPTASYMCTAAADDACCALAAAATCLEVQLPGLSHGVGPAEHGRHCCWLGNATTLSGRSLAVGCKWRCTGIGQQLSI